MNKGLAATLIIAVLLVGWIMTKPQEGSTPDNTSSIDTGKPPTGSGGIYIPNTSDDENTTDVEEPTEETLDLKFYSDSELENRLTMIDWGYMIPGQNKTIDFYIRNDGGNIIAPALYITNWVLTDENETALDSSYEQYFNVTWNCPAVIEPQEIVSAAIYLYVSPVIQNVTNFSFNIIVSWMP